RARGGHVPRDALGARAGERPRPRHVPARGAGRPRHRARPAVPFPLHPPLRAVLRSRARRLPARPDARGHQRRGAAARALRAAAAAPGAARATDRGPPRAADPAAWRGRGAGSAPPVHGDARRPEARGRGDARGARRAGRRALGGHAAARAGALTSGRVRRVLAVPTVSVIVVTRDRPRFLADALASVVAQERSPLEVRLGDDGGGNAAAVVDRIPLLELTLLPLALGHAGAARNAAEVGARGEVRSFLDGADLWQPQHL